MDSVPDVAARAAAASQAAAAAQQGFTSQVSLEPVLPPGKLEAAP